MAQAMDSVTNNCDWSIHSDLKALPRAQFLSWMWQVKFAAAKNVAHVTDKMLHACGGTGYKPRPLEIERYLRDGKAGWVMGPTNEVLRQFVGKASLLGFGALDYWNQSINERVLNNEVKKMSAKEKQRLCRKAPRRNQERCCRLTFLHLALRKAGDSCHKHMYVLASRPGAAIIMAISARP